MRIVKDLKKLRFLLDEARRQGKTIGFVPTMGYVHEGHLGLARLAKKEMALSVVSIYVNPAQFGPKEDFKRYPRDFKRDSSLLKKENVDILFVPSDNDVYPQGYLTYIDVEEISQGLCGAFRPGHFRGVATVVAKLLNLLGPCTMYLGAKDAQQVAVLKVLVKDLNFPVKVRVMPTVREPDGLAMSSRNVHLSAIGRREAQTLYIALKAAKKAILRGERSSATIIRMIKSIIGSQTNGKIQYIACVDVNTLKALKRLKGHILIALAVFFDKTRLIDNISVRIHESN